MSEAAITAAIKGVLENVTGAVNVSDYERWAADWDKIMALIKDPVSGRIHAWMISWTGQQTTQATAGLIERAHFYKIKGLYALKDADESEKAFRLIVQAVVEAFDGADRTLGASCLTIDPDWGPMEGAVGIQVDVVENRIVGGMLCHVAECRLCAIEEKDQ